jgi:phosphatidylglycerol lysyltransferase
MSTLGPWPFGSPPGLVAATEPPASSRFAWQRVLLALAVAAMGLIDLLSALLSRPPARLMALLHIVPTGVLDTSRTFTLLAGTLLLVTAWGLRRGKRRAFVAALFLCAVSVPVNLLKAFDFEEATVAATLLFLLGVSGDAFRVRSRAWSLAALRSPALGFAFGLAVYAVGGCWLIEVQHGRGGSLTRAFAEAAYQLLGIGQPALEVPRHHRVVTWFLDSIGLLGLTGLVGLALAALRPARHRRRHRAEAGRVAALLHEHGDSSVSAFALGDDIDYFFSRNARAVIAYRFESDTLLVIGDPLGPPEERTPLLRDFAAYCRANDWQFAFFQSRPERSADYRAEGWKALHIGEDPVLWTDRFTLEGPAVATLRRVVRKAESAGIEVRHFVPGQDPWNAAADSDGLLDQMRAISSAWVRAHHGGEKGFCMSRFEPHRLGDVWLAVAWKAATRRIEGFVTWVPIPARRGWALDLMRRRLDSAPGTMELLVVRSLSLARERGDAMLSLSLSALAHVEERGLGPEPPGTEAERGARAAAQAVRAREFLSQHLARFYDFEGLFRWKKKFAPEFEDRYLVYPSALALPRVALALVRAQSPGGGLRSYLRPVSPPPSRAVRVEAQPDKGAAAPGKPAESHASAQSNPVAR